MTLWLIIHKSLRHHAFSTALTAFSIALAGGLLMSVWVVREQSHAAFTGMSGGFDAVLGARSAKLQLVLNAIFHLEESPGNLAWQDFLEMQKNPNVELSVPIAMGDNYRGYRLVGTTLEFFTKAEYAPGKSCTPRGPGRIFDPAAREAVVGSLVAQKLGLKRGDLIHPFHGLLFDEEKEHAETYLVVGVLEPTNTPADRVIWIPLEGLQKMSGHDPAAATDISAVLIKLKAGSAIAGQRLSLLYNKEGNRLTFAWPIGQIMAQLFGKIAWFDQVLELVAYLIALVATGSILASLYNSMNERRREIAILRALGAHRRTVFSAIILEAATIAALGMGIGFGVYAVILTAVASIVRAQTGIVLNALTFHAVMLWAPLGLIGLSALSGIVPAAKAYRTDVAENLAPIS
jgi:putative ABC transport system permease protein